MTLLIQDKIEKIAKKSLIIQIIYLFIKKSLEHKVSKSAAALAYYILFAMFPLLVFLSNLLGLLDLNISAVMETLSHFIPKEIIGFAENYLDYVSHTSSKTLLGFALVFSIWFPMRAVSGLVYDVRMAYHLDNPKNFFSFQFRQFIYTIVFLIVIALTLFLSIMGENILRFIFGHLLVKTSVLSGYLLNFWQYVRFVPVGVLMFVAIGMLYAMSMDERKPFKSLLPGIIFSLLSWMIVSIGFSFYVENFANYSIIYGTLGTVIILIMWLYMTSLILILGAELNASIISIKNKKDNSKCGK